MTVKILSALCAALLVAACGNTPAEQPLTTPGSDLASANSGAGIDSTGGANNGIVAGSLAEFNSTKVGNTIQFATDSASLDAPAQEALKRQAAWLLQYRQHTATVEGHADERGTREYNLALGERRAQSAVNYLIALGIDPARLKEISYGKERPICPDTGEVCWAQNRRAVTALDN